MFDLQGNTWHNFLSYAGKMIYASHSGLKTCATELRESASRGSVKVDFATSELELTVYIRLKVDSLDYSGIAHHEKS